MIKNRNFRDYTIEKLQDPKIAQEYLEISLSEYLEDNDREAFYQALKDVVDARGGATAVAKDASMSRQNLYKLFSGKTSPRMETIGHLLNSLGLTLSIKALS